MLRRILKLGEEDELVVSLEVFAIEERERTKEKGGGGERKRFFCV